MIYFIQAGDEAGPVKIGYAGSVRAIHARLALFQTAHMETLVLLGFVEGDKGVEREFHGMSAADRLRGEWFGCSDDLLDAAMSAAVARGMLDRFQSFRRWRSCGFVSAAGALTERGRVYFMEVERSALFEGYHLETFADDLVADFAAEPLRDAA